MFEYYSIHDFNKKVSIQGATKVFNNVIKLILKSSLLSQPEASDCETMNVPSNDISALIDLITIIIFIA